jgi:hypothetical protein
MGRVPAPQCGIPQLGGALRLPETVCSSATGTPRSATTASATTLVVADTGTTVRVRDTSGNGTVMKGSVNKG